MNAQQIQLVQETFDLISMNSSTVADSFYRRLFELDPDLRPLFKGDMTLQGAKFMRTLSVLVWGLHQTEKFTPIVRALGKQHRGYGVQHAHYETVGEALLWAFKQQLSDRFTPEIETAWIAAYELLAEAMQEAAEPAKTTG